MDDSKVILKDLSDMNSPQKPSKKKLKLDDVRGGSSPTNSAETDGTLVDSAPATPGDIGVVPPDSTMPKWFAAFVDRFNNFERKVERILTTQIGELNSKIAEQADKIGAIDFECSKLQKEVEGLKQQNVDLAASLDDLENRSRRNNLIFYGLPEEGQAEDCRKSLATMLHKHVGLSPTSYSLERVHRTPTNVQYQASRNAKPQSTKPRMMHACFTSYTMKQKVKSECLKHFQQEYEGNKLAVVEDLSKRVRSLRKARMGEFQKLKENKQKPFFIYPAKLAYKDASNGKLVIV